MRSLILEFQHLFITRHARLTASLPPDWRRSPGFSGIMAVLAARNLLRGLVLRLPSGQGMARSFGIKPMTSSRADGWFTGSRSFFAEFTQSLTAEKDTTMVLRPARGGRPCRRQSIGSRWRQNRSRNFCKNFKARSVVVSKCTRWVYANSSFLYTRQLHGGRSGDICRGNATMCVRLFTRIDDSPATGLLTIVLQSELSVVIAKPGEHPCAPLDLLLFTGTA